MEKTDKWQRTFLNLLITIINLKWFSKSFVAFLGGGNLPRQVYMLNANLIYISSTINPFIYWLMNKDFRRAFKEVLPFFSTSTENSGNSMTRGDRSVGAPTDLTVQS